jgi:hypothetical protein
MCHYQGALNLVAQLLALLTPHPKENKGKYRGQYHNAFVVRIEIRCNIYVQLQHVSIYRGFHLLK